MEQDYKAQEAAVAAREWWNDIEERSLGTCHVPEWNHIWISVMLRRVIPEGRLYRFRSLRSWQGLIDEQILPNDPRGPEFQSYEFFHAIDSPWSILRRAGKGDYGIGRVPSLDEDIEYARGLQSKRMEEENLLRLRADRKWTAFQAFGKNDYFTAGRARRDVQ